MRILTDNLAEAGFFFTWRGEETKCFHCGLTLVQWESNDDPWLEHKMWNPKCKFIMGTKGYTLRDATVRRLRRKAQVPSYPGPPPDMDEVNAGLEAALAEEARPTNEPEEVLTQTTYIAPPSSPVSTRMSVSNNSIESLEQISCYQVNCQKCMSKPVDCTTLPCSHSLQCFDCLADKDACDYCYTPFKYIIRCIPK